jgi:hypothetical protein
MLCGPLPLARVQRFSKLGDLAHKGATHVGFIVVCVIAIGFFGMRPDRRWQADSSPSVGAPTAEQYRKFERLLAFVRARNARNYAISSPNSIDEGNYVPVGGIEQWITIRGEDRNNPVL